MKYADPMADLEETVRRGINDPLNNPNFIMNSVNEDYFHRNFAHDTSLYGGALPRQSVESSMHSNAHVFDLTPQRAIADNAVKSNLVANHVSPLMRLRPQRPTQANAGKMGNIPHAPLIDRLRSLLLAREKSNRMNNLQSFVSNNNKENINPLTGLPEDLEAKAYGAITSIESVSDQPANQPPQTVTVNVNTAGVTRNHLKPAMNRHGQATNTLNAKRRRLSEPQTQMSPSVIASTIGSNYDSIKSFLEADDILRKGFQ